MKSLTDNYSIKKKEIVDSFVKLIDHEGLKNITVQQICDEAGISVGTFYYYFKSKDTIVDDMYELMDNYFLLNKKSIKSELSYKKQVLKFVNYFIDYVYNWGYYANLLVMRSSISINFNMKQDLNRVVYHLLFDILDNAKKDRLLVKGTDSNNLNTLIFLTIRGHLLQWTKDKDYDVKTNLLSHMNIIVDNYIKN